MKTRILLLASLLAVTGAVASVDPVRPMVTGRGNADTRPGRVIVTHQTAEKQAEVVKLDKFVVTGSLMPHAPKPATRK